LLGLAAGFVFGKCGAWRMWMTSRNWKKNKNLLIRVSLCAASILLLIVAGTNAAQDRKIAAQASVAGPTEIEGELQVVHQDFKHSGRYIYYLKTPQRVIRLHFRKTPPTNFLTGAHVRVRGTQQPDGSVMLASGGTSVKNMSAPTSSTTPPLLNTLGAQSTLVILVNFQDDPGNQPYTVADAQSVVFGTTSSFILENSYQQAWLSGEVVGWYTIPLSSTTCDASRIESYAQSAASAAGADLSAYSHFIYAFPQDNACGWAGSSFIGGSPSQSWINGTNSSASLDSHVLAHELGHAFGLWHSHLLDCGTGSTIGSNCTVVEYGDILDTMGGSQPASPQYNAFQKERLGWLNSGASPSIATVQSSGTYTINTYETGGSGPTALKILKSTDPATGAKTWYYVESRQAVGTDAFLTNGGCGSCYTQNETNGVLVHIGTDGDGNSSDLLDMTPATPTYYWWFDPSLVAGQSFADPASGVTLTAESVTSAAATVTVQFAGGMTVATNQQSYNPGQTVSATATVTSEGSPVVKAAVKFTITKADGTLVTGTATTAKNGSATYNLKLKRNDPAGTYLVGAAASINGASRSATTTFAVQ